MKVVLPLNSNIKPSVSIEDAANTNIEIYETMSILLKIYDQEYRKIYSDIKIVGMLLGLSYILSGSAKNNFGTIKRQIGFDKKCRQNHG